VRVNSQQHAPIQINEEGPSHIPPPSPQDVSPQDYKEEVARALENMGILGEGREQSGNSKGQNYAPKHSALTGSLNHDETLHRFPAL